MRQITINDLPVGRSVDETLRLIQAFQFVEKHGEGKPISNLEINNNHYEIAFLPVCPANWKPESPTIKPDPVGSKDYFNKVN